MKKNLFMVAAVALMALVSCNKEIINNVGEPQESQTPEVVEPSYYVEFTADLGAEETVTPTVQQSATRTTIDVADKKTLWVEGDAISVNGTKFVVKELIDGGKSATFVNAEELPANFEAPYTAKYPYKANQTVEIPATQTAVEGGINPAYVPAVAYSDDNLLSFKHAASILKFQVPAACNKVELSSDDPLSGTLTVTPTEYDGVPTISAATKTVTVNGPFAADQYYYLAVLPGTKKNFVVKVDSKVSKEAESVTIARSTIVNMKTLPMFFDINVCISDLGWTMVNMHRFNNSGDLTAWPGEKLTESQKIGGKTYYKFSVEYGTTLSVTYNNGNSSSNFKIDVGELTVTEDVYYRLSARGAIKVDPNDKNTFGYAIYVFDQKSKNVAPNLYAWNDNNQWKTKYGGNFSSWPGVAFSKDCYYKPADDNNWRHYYYFEIPTSLYDYKFNYIVNKKGQTNDLTSNSVTGDLYVGYWYNDANNNGFWTNTTMTTPITNLN